MLALFGTPTRQAVSAPEQVTLTDVMVILRNIQSNQEHMVNRMTRVETRLVNLLVANGLDQNGKPGGVQ